MVLLLKKIINTLIEDGYTHRFNSVAISPDNKKIVAGSQYIIRIWDLESGNLINTLTGHTDCVNSVAISPDNKKIVSGSDDKTICIWDLESGNLINTLTGILIMFVQ